MPELLSRNSRAFSNSCFDHIHVTRPKPFYSPNLSFSSSSGIIKYFLQFLSQINVFRPDLSFVINIIGHRYNGANSDGTRDPWLRRFLMLRSCEWNSRYVVSRPWSSVKFS